MSRSLILRLTAGRITTPSSTTAAIHLRRLHYSPIIEFPRKDSQHKDSINTEATEYTKSGSDDQTARQDQAAFDPNQTDPEKEKSTAGQGNKKTGNPLEVSPANLDVSKPKSQQGGVENSPSKKQSGHGSPKKSKKK